MNAVQRYVPRPRSVAAIEAIEWRGDMNDLPASWRGSQRFGFNGAGDLVVRIATGVQRTVSVGDFIVRGALGDYYPVPPDAFRDAWMEVPS